VRRYANEVFVPSEQILPQRPVYMSAAEHGIEDEVAGVVALEPGGVGADKDAVAGFPF
jgi:hypothetical protein